MVPSWKQKHIWNMNDSPWFPSKIPCEKVKLGAPPRRPYGVQLHLLTRYLEDFGRLRLSFSPCKIPIDRSVSRWGPSDFHWFGVSSGKFHHYRLLVTQGTQGMQACFGNHGFLGGQQTKTLKELVVGDTCISDFFRLGELGVPLGWFCMILQHIVLFNSFHNF